MTEMTLREFQSLGGQAILKQKGKAYFKELAKKSVAARKAKKNTAQSPA